VGNGGGLVDTVRNEKAKKIVISLSERRGVLPIKDLLACKLSGVEVVDAPSFYEELTGKLLIEDIKPSWFVLSDGFRKTGFRSISKRIFDILFAIICLAITVLYVPIIALLIKLDSRGSVFFRQVRTGEGGKDFLIYKFRTMRQDAESETGAVWAQKNDTRITRMGRFLRKSRLDELPQLFNVLKGDMSFIGPRPERPEMITALEVIIPYYSERHSVKPGITGWAQVKYSYGGSVEDAIEKLKYDLFYIKHMSLFLDLLILLETVKVVLFGRGGR
jgi:sugar transferase (PEP-CTERM system associated)